MEIGKQVKIRKSIKAKSKYIDRGNKLSVNIFTLIQKNVIVTKERKIELNIKSRGNENGFQQKKTGSI